MTYDWLVVVEDSVCLLCSTSPAPSPLLRRSSLERWHRSHTNLAHAMKYLMMFITSM